MPVNDLGGKRDKHFLLPNEVWWGIGDYIADERSLKALICTSRWFNDFFVRILRGQLILPLFEKPPDQWSDRGLPPGVWYTKSLEILVWDSNACNFSFQEDTMYTKYASYLTTILENMPNLKSFRWSGYTINSPRASWMLREDDLLHKLKRKASLRNLSLLVSGFRNDGDPILYVTIFTGFKNLTSLELYEFEEFQNHVLDGLTQVICDNLCLKKLGLGMNSNIYVAEDVDPGPADGFLEKLCLQCCASIGFMPLKLDFLRLGIGLHLQPPITSCQKYFAKLVDTRVLRTLHIYNGTYVDTDASWELLGHCPALRQLEVTMLDDSTLKWLNSNASFIQELIIMQPIDADDNLMYNIEGLKLSDLKVFWMTETTSRYTTIFSDSDLGSKDEDEEEADPESEVENHTTGSTEQEQHSLSLDEQSADSGNAAFMIDPLSKTVLDRLHDHGCRLERLFLCLNLDTQWGYFQHHLSVMRNLKQLRLESRLQPSPEQAIPMWLRAFLWPPGSIKLRFARFLKCKCPSLQFIMLDSLENARAWEVTAPINLNSLSEADAFSRILLRELSPEEIVSIPLFAINYHTPQSGMSSSSYLYCYDKGVVLPRRHEIEKEMTESVSSGEYSKEPFDVLRELEESESSSPGEEPFDIVGEFRQRFEPNGENSLVAKDRSVADDEAVVPSSIDEQSENQAEDQAGVVVNFPLSDSEQSEDVPRYRKRMRLWVKEEIKYDEEADEADDEVEDEDENNETNEGEGEDEEVL